MAEMHGMCCGECGIEFTVPEHFYQERLKTGKGWNCPNGHNRAFKESEADKMRRERDIAIQQRARSEQEAAREVQLRLKAERETKRLKKRAAAGTCPCCQRTVTQMARHMKTKHPEFVVEETTNVVPMKVAK